jgi:hypothetical protein
LLLLKLTYSFAVTLCLQAGTYYVYATESWRPKHLREGGGRSMPSKNQFVRNLAQPCLLSFSIQTCLLLLLGSDHYFSIDMFLFANVLLPISCTLAVFEIPPRIERWMQARL